MKTITRRIINIQHGTGSAWLMTCITLWLAPQQLMAALPVQQEPTTIGAGTGDWLNLILGYIGDTGKVIALAIATLGFLIVSYVGFSKFNEARQGRGEWGEVIVAGVIGAGLLLVSSFLLTESSTTINEAIQATGA